ncbi:MAG: DUF1294 domain-containing protein [Bacillota bacterium]|nr:DUF1294 domain-containing protein [Bacillota bacterium]
MKYILIFVSIINILTFMIYGVDKYKAKHNRWRISENVLIGMAIFGGSIGALLGMYFFHHKTKKYKFSLGIPCILLIQAGFIVYFLGGR